MLESPVDYRVDGAMARLTLNSPNKRNALSTALIDALGQGLANATADPRVRLVALGHTGGTFCAGADLSESGAAPDEQLAVGRAREMTALLRALLQCPLPVVGVVDGHVRAGGMGLLGACDIVVAGTRSTFALTEARLGVSPAIISLTLLPKMSARAAGRYFLTGETFGPERAAEIGLVTIAAQTVEAELATIADALAKGSPQGLAASKALVTDPILREFDRDADRLARVSAGLFLSEEASEGMTAFLQRRSPSWVRSAGN
ncbi:enoyl-CoA hydratase family protein [Mycolicibacter sp. MYC123]|uniref:Enoyl-CoA hydratase family protein n=1 Tax=[Mycobacterium] zoologicum TaxID=2872311 RepID=A0ABU5YTK3_9MYCO|nr:enoyl-CoA hydratase family protein [Mycolicibacter sp. MYC123]MEB3052289.1 enoyl-CoA hydratase family protein [Mycolicibacter sp. MYC123]